ncbi:carbohydrate-binding module family 20 domain-containing protein [Streptomyces sp. NPDC002078]
MSSAAPRPRRPRAPSHWPEPSPFPRRPHRRTPPPPEESLKQCSYYWWDVYQPYSYSLNSPFGSQAKFSAMITACHKAGVKVYTDAVINQDSSGNVTWESNANRSATTTTSALSLNNSWNVADADATDVTFNENATTDWGTNVYIVGSIPSLGSWNTSDAVPLSSASYPNWSRLVIVPKSTTFEYKYLKKDGSGNVTWEAGTNRPYTTGSSSGYTTSIAWK